MGNIIVLMKFDHGIQANIIKAKLDAYGIPCFLSEEHLTNMMTSFLSGGIRLHIFEEDKEQVIQLLLEESIQRVDDEDVLICPNCKSKRILNITDDKFNPGYVVKVLLQLEKPHYCMECEEEFD